ncbi:MAG: DUF555 domain-containing protein [Candidatus Altiarchaeota archaeon]|nr:DUF555 domain-containing protein [Candidatus Altiarchaeota archaeon]
MDYNVKLLAGFVVRNVQDEKEAIAVSITKVGRALNKAGLRFVQIDGERKVMTVSGLGLVGLELSMKVFNAESEEHAGKVAKAVMGRALDKVPLEVLEINESQSQEDEDETD